MLERGQVRIESGRVTHVGNDLRAAFPSILCEGFSGCVLIPGLVNSHTHLELTALRGLARGLPFAEWIQAITAECARHDEQFWSQSARQGARQCLQVGVTSVADYSTFGVSARAISEAGMRAYVFRESFFADPRTDVDAGIAVLREGLERMERDAGPGVAVGLSLHAPYNAAKPALRAVARDLGRYRRSIHAAESPDEDLYVREGRGVFADAHRARGIPVEARQMSPVEYLDSGSYWRSGTLAVHLTQASRGDFAILKARGVAAAFCPSSNAALGVGIPRIALARRVGLQCGLGTDSAISCERLDMFEEMRFALLTSRLRNDPLTPEDVFAMATWEGAAAAGIEDAGRIVVGSPADIVAVRLKNEPGEASPVAALVHQASACDVRAVWVGGRRVYRRQ